MSIYLLKLYLFHNEETDETPCNFPLGFEWKLYSDRQDRKKRSLWLSHLKVNGDERRKDSIPTCHAGFPLFLYSQSSDHAFC